MSSRGGAWGGEPWQPEAPLAQPQQRDTDVYKARLKHLQSSKSRKVIHARACRLQGRGREEVRWPHPEDMAGGTGNTELGCLLEEEVGMVLLREHLQGRDRGTAHMCMRGPGLCTPWPFRQQYSSGLRLGKVSSMQSHLVQLTGLGKALGVEGRVW